MLQIALAIILLLAPEAYAQTGAVTSMQRAGGVPQRILDKLKALEDKRTVVSAAFNTIDTKDGNPTACTGATVAINDTCPSITKNRDGLLVARTTGLVALSGTSALNRLQTEMNANGCSTATWTPCTMDNLRQAFALKNSDASTNVFGIAIGSKFLSFDGGHSLPIAAAPAVTNHMCQGLNSSAAGVRGMVMLHTNEEAGVFTGFATAICSASVYTACCRIP